LLFFTYLLIFGSAQWYAVPAPYFFFKEGKEARHRPHASHFFAQIIPPFLPKKKTLFEHN